LSERFNGLFLLDETLADITMASRDARQRKLGLNHRHALPKMNP
jgi:hypothetical protein